MDIATQKGNLIKWIQELDDSEILDKLEFIKSEETFDSEKEWKRSISIEEARIKSKEFSKRLPWKK